MSFIVKMILKLLHNNKIKTYIFLKNIFENKDIKDLYNGKIKNVCDKYKILFKEKMPLLFHHFEKNEIEPEIYIYSWLKTLFSFNFDENIAEYIFKIFIYKNDFNVYIYAILSILMVYEKEILSKNSENILSLLFSIKTVDINLFIENIQKLSKL